MSEEIQKETVNCQIEKLHKAEDSAQTTTLTQEQQDQKYAPEQSSPEEKVDSRNSIAPSSEINSNEISTVAPQNSSSIISPLSEIEECLVITKKIKDAISRRIVGQDQIKNRLLAALIADGHILLEGVPGLAKTLSIKTLAEAVDGSFHRIQFTPDLLPADLIGTEVFRPQEGTFEVRRGPVFANFVLADEINRAPAKVQSALLETMQEHQVTIGRQSFKVPEPFFVLATQNPIEQEGTYPLPEAQIDRFLLKLKITYPIVEHEKQMLDLVTQPSFSSTPQPSVATLEDLQRVKKAAESIYVDERIKQYIINLVNATRHPSDYGLNIQSLIEIGASPRATIALFLVSRAEAFLGGAKFVVPQHIKDIALEVLRHRIIPTYEAEAEGLDSDDIVKMVLDGVQVP